MLTAVNQAEPPSPFELVQGLRRSGRPDLALEYLQDIDKRLSNQERSLIPLERALCLLVAAREEAEEGKRESLLGEARLLLNQFLQDPKHKTHPRAVEANLALADTSAVQAQVQLSRALRIEIPPPPAQEDPRAEAILQERERALQQRRKEANKAAPLFEDAVRRYASASRLLKQRLEESSLTPQQKQRLYAEIFEIELRSAINQSRMAETVLGDSPQDTQLRSSYREKALQTFEQLAKQPETSRSAWIARAWKAEMLQEMGKPKEAEAEFAAIAKVNLSEANDGKRLAEFFQLRREYLTALRERNPARLEAITARLRQWLERYSYRRQVPPEDEQWAVRFYLAYTLQTRADILVQPSPKGTKATSTLPERAKALYQEAERHYRLLSQQPNDYQNRAERYRLYVLRRIIGDAVRPVHQFRTFEEAQIAGLIQLARLLEMEETSSGSDTRWEERLHELKEQKRAWSIIGAELRRRLATQQLPTQRRYVIALLERARELATPQDDPNDVLDNLLRLVAVYLQHGEPQRAAVLGEHIVRHLRAPAHKLTTAGLMAVNGYLMSTASSKPDLLDPTALQQLLQQFRQSDRTRALQLAQHLDQNFPNEPTTDAIRLRLAILLIDERQGREAYQLIIRIRPGFPQIGKARLVQSFLALNLITSEDSPLSEKEKIEVYRRTIQDLYQLSAPVEAASGEQVCEYYQTQARLGQLYLLQKRFLPQLEKSKPGYQQARELADRLLKDLPQYKNLSEVRMDKKDGSQLTLDGQEATLLARDLQLRASVVHIAELLDKDPPQYKQAETILTPIIDDLLRTGPLLTDKLKQWSSGEGDAGDDEATKRQKAQIANLATTIDRSRREIGLLGFRLAVEQGQIEEARRRLSALKKIGLTVETSADMYEQLARQLAVRLAQLQKQKQQTEATSLAQGVQLLLHELRSAAQLTPRTILFIAQTLATIGEHETALQEAEKIPPPSTNGLPGINTQQAWWLINTAEISDNQARTRFQDACRDYRIAQLIKARSLRNLGRLDEAEKLLRTSIGTKESPGWAYTSLEMRRELALTYEAKATAAGDKNDVKTATAEWRNALNEWTTMFQFAQAAVRRLDNNTPAEQVRRTKNAFFDAYYEVQRVLVAANKQLQKNKPDALQRSLETVGRRIAEMEISNKIADHEANGNSIILPETWNRYYELLADEPVVKKAYQANQGKLFLQPPPQQ
jgi:hypothetical protein